MGKVILDMSMSLDGFIAGHPDQPERLHDWMFPASGEPSAENQAVMGELMGRLGATIAGRNTYDLGDSQDGFVDDPYQVLNVILSHSVPEKPAKGNTQFVFVADGVESALEQARAAAGDKDIAIGGGASVAQQYLKAGLVDEVWLHFVPVLMGGGLRLFGETEAPIELEQYEAIAAEGVTHLKFRVVR